MSRQKPWRAAMLVAAGGFLGLAVLGLVAAARPLPDADVWLLKTIVSLRTGQLVRLAQLVTDLGTTQTALIISLPVLAWLAFRGHWRPALLLAAAFSISLTSRLLKVVVGRPRPSPHLLGFTAPDMNSFSFPSGHAALAMAVYGFLIVLAFAYVRLPVIRWLVAGLLGAIIVLVALSRVYLGVHFPADVLGGMFLGLGWLGFLSWGLSRSKSQEPV